MSTTLFTIYKKISAFTKIGYLTPDQSLCTVPEIMTRIRVDGTGLITVRGR